ncbi:hypothetical protein JOF42_001141 [Microbacterium phyllosphaerae]|uniref:DUF3180 domain-containing protein n=1 Tax=Microbacterium phyllosphaerae TaxID=124798 RepID=A0ABS4WN59_9MICO|nr:DUF3180 domain-containing protein [Microbacterium phyllosphaerae]MBP2377646.1 hypothetical protein [Microbacterium phyllosphaerae]MCS3442431.1 hypothetical protein [Microbacterium phyllosphaerae]
MKRTSVGLLVVLAILAGAAGFVLDHMLTAMGRTTFTPSLLLPVLLLLIAAASLGVAWPVRSSVRNGIRIDPFRATRAVTLARASSLVGALMAGFGAGLLVFLLTRPIDPPVGSTVAMLALIGSAIVLAVAALIAEQFCILPKDPDDSEPRDRAGDPGPAELGGGH